MCPTYPTHVIIFDVISIMTFLKRDLGNGISNLSNKLRNHVNVPKRATTLWQYVTHFKVYYNILSQLTSIRPFNPLQSTNTSSSSFKSPFLCIMTTGNLSLSYESHKSRCYFPKINQLISVMETRTVFFTIGTDSWNIIWTYIGFKFLGYSDFELN
jgi:hypothetical protein